MSLVYHPQAAPASPASSARPLLRRPEYEGLSVITAIQLDGLQAQALAMRLHDFDPESIRAALVEECRVTNQHVTDEQMDGLLARAAATPIDERSVARFALEHGVLVPALQHAVLDPASDDDGPRPDPRFRILTAQQMKALPPPEWLVDGLLVRNTLAGIVGEAATFKSFFALGIAFGVAAGLDVLGLPVHQGTVVYISAEGVAGIGRRVVALEVTHGVAAPDGLCFLPKAVQMLEAGDVAALLDALATIPEKPSLVVVDTLARCMAGGDENSAQDMGVFVRSVDEVRRATGACVLCLHHVTKATGQIRGSTALLGALDTLIEMKRRGDAIDSNCAKQKDFEQFQPMVLTPRVVRFTDGQSSVVLEAGAVGDGGLTKGQEVVGQALLDASDAGAAWISNKEWLNACPADLVPESSFYRARKELAQAGYVESRGSGRVASFRPTEKLTLTLNSLSRDSHESSPHLTLTLSHSFRSVSVRVSGEREQLDV